MAIIVEDGTSIENANSFVSLIEGDAYHLARSNSIWNGLTSIQKETALIRGADYINTLLFKGIRSFGDQTMVFPRTGLYDRDGYLLEMNSIPSQLKSAQCEAALREAVSTGVLQPDLERGGQIKKKKVDILETEWFEGAESNTTFSAITNLLRTLLASSNVKTIVRS